MNNVNLVELNTQELLSIEGGKGGGVWSHVKEFFLGIWDSVNIFK